MSDPTNNRKVEHIRIIGDDPDTDRQAAYFDQIQLQHRALPELALSAIDTRTEFLGRPLSFPLLISSMTGGDHDLVARINRNLAEAAQRCGVALAVGSQRVMFTHPAARNSFELRKFAPDIPLLANMGAVQLNYGMGIVEAQAAVDCLQADGLYLHLNPLQEAVQPEGDTDFSGLADKIAAIAGQLSVPVLLKEVGCGLTAPDIELGLKAGVRHFDVAGAGGTSWSRIEHHRAGSGDDLGLKFQDWGVPTPVALQQSAVFLDRATIVASGGLRDGIDMVKSVILGASLCGMAAPFLQPAMKSADAVVVEIEKLHQQFTTAMFLLGVPDIKTLFNNRTLVLDKY
ncbi:type 2 isopentenyl-diphosphate Delta-isomerase [Pontibacter sp. JAM-7]|uniref:type 2 isopentenyl-diphosphate Delta-isomerase n=1 Tax=Pontibacter sp. JAM-7 TaxID=3366581 RepID=UPI003AF97568